MKQLDEEFDPILTRSDEEWVLILERTLKHPIEDVWAALTESDQLPAWGLLPQIGIWYRQDRSRSPM